jgi:hypothetical protein
MTSPPAAITSRWRGFGKIKVVNLHRCDFLAEVQLENPAGQPWRLLNCSEHCAVAPRSQKGFHTTVRTQGELRVTVHHCSYTTSTVLVLFDNASRSELFNCLRKLPTFPSSHLHTGFIKHY